MIGRRRQPQAPSPPSEPATASDEGSAELIRSFEDSLPSTAERITQWREDDLIRSGVQLYVSLDGSVVADIAQGEAQPGVAMTTGSICKQYCTIKPLTAIAVAQLVSARSISLDQPVSFFIPDFAANSKDRITLRHILTHTSGLFDAQPRRYPDTPEELLTMICDSKAPPGFAPGAKAAYSRLFGWQVLGRIVEIVTGTPFSRHLREQLLIPLGMEDSWVGMSTDDYLRVQDRLAVNYVSYEKEPDLLPPPGQEVSDLACWDRTAPWGPFWFELTEESCTQVMPAFGGYCPARDLGRFYEALLTPSRLPSDGQIHGDVLAEFISAQRSGMYDSVLGRVCDYGLGFMVNLRGHHFGDYCSPRSFGHSGYSGSSLAFADEEHGLVVSLTFNDVLDWETAFLRRKAMVNALYKDLDLID